MLTLNNSLKALNAKQKTVYCSIVSFAVLIVYKYFYPNAHPSWQLQQVLESLGYTHISETYHCLLQAGFASQLESYGLWEWAVFILLHIRDDKRLSVCVIFSIINSRYFIVIKSPSLVRSSSML